MLLTKKQKQSGSTQKGITVGVITATMVAALAVGGLWSRMNTQSEAMAASNAYQADAAINLMLVQAGQLQEAVKVAAENTTVPSWTHVANYHGKLSLVNATQAYITEFSVPSTLAPFIETRINTSFKGFARNPDSTARLEWQFGALTGYGYRTVMAWLPLNYPSLCVSINEKLGLGATEFRLGYAYQYEYVYPASARVNLPSGHVAYSHVVDAVRGTPGLALIEYQRWFRANAGSHISEVQLPLGSHRIKCLRNSSGFESVLMVILYHGPMSTAI